MGLQGSGFIAVTTYRAIWVGLFLCLATMLARAEVPVPPLAARVMDQTATLDAADLQSLEAKLAALEQARGAQIAVLVVASTQPESIEQYALRVAESWKLGRKGVDDGVLLLLAKEDRTLRIEVGYGLEGAIPDALAKRIIAEVMVPRLQAGDFAGSVHAGVDALIKMVEGEPLSEPKSRSAILGVLEALIPMVMMFVAVVGGILRLLFGRLVGAVIAATVAFIGAWIMFGGLFISAIVAVVTLVFTLIGVGLGRLGGGGAVGSSGGGGGGFGGGGGGFGGGGASGRW